MTQTLRLEIGFGREHVIGLAEILANTDNFSDHSKVANIYNDAFKNTYSDIAYDEDYYRRFRIKQIPDNPNKFLLESLEIMLKPEYLILNYEGKRIFAIQRFLETAQEYILPGDERNTVRGYIEILKNADIESIYKRIQQQVAVKETIGDRSTVYQITTNSAGLLKPGYRISGGKHNINLVKRLYKSRNSEIWLSISDKKRRAVKFYSYRKSNPQEKVQRQRALGRIEEVMPIAKLHPNIITYMPNNMREEHMQDNFDESGTGYYYVFSRHYRLGSLDRFAKKHIVTEQEKLDYLKQIASAIDHLHDNGFIHCDVKASNILMGQKKNGEYFPVLSDLDSCCRVNFNEDHRNGTYRAPEQKTGKPVFASDIYGLGGLAFWLLEDGVQDPSNEEFRRWLERLPPEVRNIYVKATDKDKNRRYKTATEFIDVLIAVKKKQSNIASMQEEVIANTDVKQSGSLQDIDGTESVNNISSYALPHNINLLTMERRGDKADLKKTRLVQEGQQLNEAYRLQRLLRFPIDTDTAYIAVEGVDLADKTHIWKIRKQANQPIDQFSIDFRFKVHSNRLDYTLSVYGIPNVSVTPHPSFDIEETVVIDKRRKPLDIAFLIDSSLFVSEENTIPTVVDRLIKLVDSPELDVDARFAAVIYGYDDSDPGAIIFEGRDSFKESIHEIRREKEKHPFPFSPLEIAIKRTREDFFWRKDAVKHLVWLGNRLPRFKDVDRLKSASQNFMIFDHESNKSNLFTDGLDWEDELEEFKLRFIDVNNYCISMKINFESVPHSDELKERLNDVLKKFGNRNPYRDTDGDWKVLARRLGHSAKEVEIWGTERPFVSLA